MTATVIYDSFLHTTGTHLQSGTIIETDAPVDNGGKGEKFSPTDLVVAALASCMCTIMGLSASSRGIQLGRIECRVEKIMASGPRRIGEIIISLLIDGPVIYSEQERATLERAAVNCPVYLSLHPDCIKTVSFTWPGANDV